MEKKVVLDFWGMTNTKLIDTMRNKIFKKGFKQGERPKQKLQQLDKYGQYKSNSKIFEFKNITDSETLIAVTVYKMMRTVDDIIKKFIKQSLLDNNKPISDKKIDSLVNDYKESGRANRILRNFKKNVNNLFADGKYNNLANVANDILKGKNIDYIKQFLSQAQLQVVLDIYNPNSNVMFSEGEIEYNIPTKYTIGVHKSKDYTMGLDMPLKDGAENCVCKIIDDTLFNANLINSQYSSSKYLTSDELENGVNANKDRIYKLLNSVSKELCVYLNFKIRDCINKKILVQVKVGTKLSERYDIEGYQYANHLYPTNPLYLNRPRYANEQYKVHRVKEEFFIENFMEKNDYNATFVTIPEFKIISFWDNKNVYLIDNGIKLTDENQYDIDDTPLTKLSKQFGKKHRKISHNNKVIKYYTGENKITRKILIGAIYTKDECEKFGIPGDFSDHQIIDKKDAYATAIKDCYYSWNKDGSRWMTGVPCESIYKCDNSIFQTDTCGLVFIRMKKIPRELCPRDFVKWSDKECSDANIELLDLVDRAMNFIEAKYWYDNGAEIEAYAINPSHRIPDTFTPFIEQFNDKLERVSFIGKLISNPKKQDVVFNSQEEVDYYIDNYVAFKDSVEIHYVYGRYFVKHNTGEFNHGKYPHIHSHLMACHRILMFEKMKQIKAIGGICTCLKTDSIRFYMPELIDPNTNEDSLYPDIVQYTKDIREELIYQREHYKIYKYRNTMDSEEWERYIASQRMLLADRHKSDFDKYLKFKPSLVTNELLDAGKWKFEYPKQCNLNNLMTPKHTEEIFTNGLKNYDEKLNHMYKSFVGGAGSGKTTLKESLYYKDEFTELSPTHAVRQKAEGKYTIKKMLVLLGDEEMIDKDYFNKISISDSGIVIDEVGMVSAHEMNRLDQLLRNYFNSELYMAGFPVLVMGDSAQCNPVVTNSMMSNKNYYNMKISFFHCDNYKRFTEYKLNTNHRSGEDREFADYLNELHDAIQNDDIIKYSQMFHQFICEGTTRVETIDDLPYEKNSRYICYKVRTQDEINKRYLAKFNPKEKEITLKLNRKPYYNGDVGLLIDDMIHIPNKVAISLSMYANESTKEAFRYNYASTIYSQQGATIKHNYIIIVNDLHKDIKTFYTAISRATKREDIELYQIKNEPKKQYFSTTTKNKK